MLRSILWPTLPVYNGTPNPRSGNGASGASVRRKTSLCQWPSTHTLRAMPQAYVTCSERYSAPPKLLKTPMFPFDIHLCIGVRVLCCNAILRSHYEHYDFPSLPSHPVALFGTGLSPNALRSLISTMLESSVPPSKRSHPCFSCQHRSDLAVRQPCKLG